MKEEEEFAAIDRLRLSKDCVCFRIDLFTAFAVVATVQLASRHPGFGSAMRRIVERLARLLQAEIASAEPSLAELLEEGWNPAADIPAGTREGTPPEKPA